jgi:hypothetical protein
MSIMMEGSTEINHEKHTRDFKERMRFIVTPEHVRWVCEDNKANSDGLIQATANLSDR